MLTAAALFAVAGYASQAVAQPAQEIADQEWYPEGYLDLKNAAARQIETFPTHGFLNKAYVPPAFEVMFDTGEDVARDLDEHAAQLSALALNVARLRSRLAEVGYNTEVYDQPLLNYERGALNDFEMTRTAGTEWPSWGVIPSVIREDLSVIDWDLLINLAGEMEARRKRLNPDKPQFGWSPGWTGAGEDEFTIRLSPSTGELWLVNAFAFHVCERKVADPWDHRACGWTQYQEGDSTVASGRYMYEARWPDGTVKRGARVLQGDPEEEGGEVIAFRRN